MKYGGNFLSSSSSLSLALFPVSIPTHKTNTNEASLPSLLLLLRLVMSLGRLQFIAYFGREGFFLFSDVSWKNVY